MIVTWYLHKTVNKKYCFSNSLYLTLILYERDCRGKSNSFKELDCLKHYYVYTTLCNKLLLYQWKDTTWCIVIRHGIDSNSLVKTFFTGLCVCIWVYLYSPSVALMGESSKRVLLIFDFCRIVQDTDTERFSNFRSLSWFPSVPSVKALVHGTSISKVSSERLISNFSWPARD
jgi:hypothetical protein